MQELWLLQKNIFLGAYYFIMLPKVVKILMISNFCQILRDPTELIPTKFVSEGLLHPNKKARTIRLSR